MEGKATLKLRKPLKENIQNLYFENYDVYHCEYVFNKGITKGGDIRTEILGGNIRVVLPMFPTNDLLSWAFDSEKKLNGEISIHDAYEESLEKIYFEDARCVEFHIHYEPGTHIPNVMLSLTINARRMIIGDVEYKNPYSKK
ncbi:MAG: hypothetical protein LBT27_05195 [Prevotellaceae bacterium]|jgi:hypothetical protein|nr:hypothetical protein [Prevotellaceae bacterium]